MSDTERLARNLLVELVNDYHDYVGQTVAGDDFIKRVRALLRAPAAAEAGPRDNETIIEIDEDGVVHKPTKCEHCGAPVVMDKFPNVVMDKFPSVSGGAVRIKKAADVWKLREDALTRLDAALLALVESAGSTALPKGTE